MRNRKYPDVFTRDGINSTIVNTFEISKMKKPKNFRLSNNSISILERLSEDLDKTKTEVLEEAIKSYERKVKSKELKKKNHPLRKFAGMFTEKEADDILVYIKKSRKSKNYSNLKL